MSDFKREERYIVIKLSDLNKDQKTLVTHGLKANNIPTRECVVVEKHWPIYDAVWKLIEGLGGKKFPRPSNDPYRENPAHYRDGM